MALRWRHAMALLAAMAFATASQWAAASSVGDLDTSFNTNGYQTIVIGAHWSEGMSIAVQSTGKIVVAGHRLNGFQFDPAIARFNTDGSLDTGFGSAGTGIVVSPWPGGASISEWINRSGGAVDVALMADDRIVVTSSPDGEDMGIMVFTADGVLDATFDGDGRKKIAAGAWGFDVWAQAVTIASDGDILVVGTNPDDALTYKMTMVRLAPDGSFDTSFSGDGSADFYWPSSVDNLANALTTNGDRILFGGSATSDWADHDMAIGQLNADGSIYTAFNGDGLKYIAFGGDADVREILVQSDGKIIGLGEAQLISNDDGVAVTRLNADGSLDTSFSGDGLFTHDFGSGNASAWGGVLDSAGRVVVVGQYDNGSVSKAFIMRLTAGGALDTTFDNDGIIEFDFTGPNAERFNAIAVSGNDVVTAGGTGSSGLAARLLNVFQSPGLTPNFNSLTRSTGCIAIDGYTATSVSDIYWQQINNSNYVWNAGETIQATWSNPSNPPDTARLWAGVSAAPGQPATSWDGAVDRVEGSLLVGGTRVLELTLTDARTLVETKLEVQNGNVSMACTAASTLTPTADGFTVQVTNFDPNYSWSVSTSAGVVAIDGSGLITVTGLTPEQSATVTVTTSQPGYAGGAANTTGSALTGSALTPVFDSPVATGDGFTVQVTNFDPAYTWGASTTAGSAIIDLTGLVTVTGLSPEQSATVTVTTTRTGYSGGAADVVGAAATGVALTPAFNAVVATADGFTVQLNNYDSAYTWSVSTTVGVVSISGTGLVTVTGLGPGQSASVTVTTSRTGYADGAAAQGGTSANGPALIPTFAAPTATADGYTVQVSNHDSDYTWAVSSSAGSVTINGSGLITVTGLTPEQSATVSVTTARTGYAGGAADVVGTAATGSGLTPAFGAVVPTGDGFTVQVSNHDSDYTWAVTTSAGSVTINGSGLITVTGLTPEQSATVTVTTARTGYAGGAVDVVGTAATGSALTPAFGAVVPTGDGFTVQVSNYDSDYTWAVSSSAGSVTINGTGLITVTGLTPEQSATLTVTTARTGYAGGAADVVGTAATGTALTPTFAAPTATADGYTVQVSNHDSDYTWAVASSAGSVTINDSGLITVTGLTPEQSATVTVTTARTGYAGGAADVVGTAATGSALTPAFGAVVPTGDGFTVQVSNYDSDYTWAVSSSAGSVTINGTGLITVTGLTPEQSATATVTTARTGYAGGAADVVGTAATGSALTPTFATPTATADGYTVQVSNHDSDYTWAVSSSVGSVTISGTGLITVTGLTPEQSATVTVTTARTGYAGGAADVVGMAATGSALTPTFDAVVPTGDGFTVQVSNHDSDYTWAVTTSAGSVTINGTGLITVTGLTPEQSATVTVTTARTGYAGGAADVVGMAATGSALTPTFDAVVPTGDGFTVQVSNHDADYTWAVTTSAGSVTINGSGLITVTGLTPEQTATATVTTARTGYAGGAADVVGTATTGSALTPTFGAVVPTGDGFTVQVSNHDADYSWVVTTSAGSVTITGTGLITVTGLTPEQSATVTVTTTRTGYTNGTADVTGSAVTGDALTPAFATPDSTTEGFTVQVSNHDTDYTWSVSSTAGEVTIDASGLITVTGLTPEQSATVTVTTARTGYAGGAADVVGTAATGSALTPTFDAVVPTGDGFTVQVSNHDSDYTWAVTTSAGSVTINGTGLITVTGLTPEQSATVTVTTARTGYSDGTGDIAGSAATGSALTPVFDPVVPTGDGFTVQVSNHDADYTWAVSSSAGSVTINGTGLITVTGLTPEQAARVTVTTTRTGYTNGTADVTGSAATGDALTPTFATPTATADGFTVQVSNHDTDYTWSVSSTAGEVTIDASGLITVTGLTPEQSATVTVTTARTGYAGGAADVVGTAATGSRLTPAFGAVVPTGDGFTVQVSNHDSDYTWAVTTSAGSVTINGSGLITVTGLTPEQTATATVTTARTGYAGGAADVVGTATTGSALTPAFDAVVPTGDGFTVQVSNYDSDYTWAVTTSAGSVTIDSSGLIMVTGLTPEQSATVTVTTARTGYSDGNAAVTGVAETESDECSLPYDAGLLDTDADGIPNTCDGDDDNDGVPDTDEPAAYCVLLTDCDGDGSIDAEDPYPLAVTRFALGAEAYIETFPSNPLSTCSLNTNKSLFSPYEAPDGMESIGRQASFSLEGCDATALENVEVEVNFGQTLPLDGLVCKVEVGAEPVDMASATINDRSVRYSLRDNGPFDANPIPGVIDDPVTVLRVVATPPATGSPVPVPLHPLWSLLQMVLLSLMALRAVRTTERYRGGRVAGLLGHSRD